MKSHYLLLTEELSKPENVVTYLQALVRKSYIGKITLVGVTNFAPAAVIDYPLDYAEVLEADIELRRTVEEILRTITAQVEWQSVQYDIVALQGDKVQALTRFISDKYFDSILMMTCEGSWFTRLWSGNLFDRLRSMVRIPLTLLPNPKFVSIPR